MERYATITPDAALEPFTIEESPSFHCAVCGEGIYPGDRYIELCGVRICDDCKCFEKALMQAAESVDFEVYARAEANGFSDWLREEVFAAILEDRPVSVWENGRGNHGRDVFRAFAQSDWPHFADWYHDHIDSGEERIA